MSSEIELHSRSAAERKLEGTGEKGDLATPVSPETAKKLAALKGTLALESLKAVLSVHWLLKFEILISRLHCLGVGNHEPSNPNCTLVICPAASHRATLNLGGKKGAFPPRSIFSGT